jgi:Tol biopolymer transport system component/DNA-binding CsgD family transcriptional regulator
MARRGRPPHPEVLTPREQEVLDLLRRGLTNEQIAERLGISRDGAKFHVSQILSRLGVTTRHEAALWDAATHQPWWKKAMAVLPFPGSLKLGAKIAGGAVVASAVAGIALFVWLVLSQDIDGDRPFSLFPGLYVVDADTGAMTRLVEDLRIPDNNFQSGWPWALDWSPDGKFLAVLEDPFVNVYERSTGKLFARSPLERAWWLAWRPDGLIMVHGRLSEGGEEAAFLWDPATGALSVTTRPVPDFDCFNAVRLSACARRIPSRLEVIEANTEKILFSLEGEFNRPSISPDETRLAVYASSNTGADRELAIFDLATGAKVAGFSIDGWESIKPPAWSPDSSLIAFAEYVRGSDNQAAISIVEAQGQQTPLRQIARGESPVWSDSGDKVAFVRGGRELAVYDIKTGETRTLVSTGLPVMLEPRWDPASNSVAFLAKGGGGYVHVIDADGGREKLLAPGHTPSWSPSGDWIAFIYSLGPVYVAAPDGRKIAAVGPSFFTDAIRACMGGAKYGWSPKQDAIVLSGPNVLLAGVPPEQPPVEVARTGYGAVFSADGARLTFARPDLSASPQSPIGSCEIVELPLASTDSRRIVAGSRPVPSPDGLYLAVTDDFQPGRGSPLLITTRSNGDVVRELPERSGVYWAPVGGRLAYIPTFASAVGPRPSVSQLSLLEDVRSEPRVLLEGQFVGSVSWSPDGKKIAFSMLLEDGPAIFILSLDSPRSPRFLTYGHSPSWSPDGKRIVFAR